MAPRPPVKEEENSMFYSTDTPIMDRIIIGLWVLALALFFIGISCVK